jgi:hypothetical protein
MNGYPKTLLFALVLGALLYLPGPVKVHAAQQPKPKPQAQQQQAEEDPGYTEEEYDTYDKAAKEADSAKRIDALVAFMEKYPKSKLMSYIDASYQTTLFELQKGQNWAKLLSASEMWLKTHPDDLQAVSYAADAAEKSGNDKQYLDYAQKLYAAKPVAQLAASIQATYKKIGDNANYEVWTEKLMTLPEYAGDYGLRFVFVQKYDKEKNLTKAAEYARLTLKSLDAAKKPDNKSDADWHKEANTVRRVCYTVVGMDAYDKEKWADAISALHSAAKVDPTDTSWYYIGMCEWKQKKIEDAMISFAKAELLKGDMRAQSKDKLETLYKSLHNDTLIGVDKVYKKAQDEAAAK